MKKLKLFSASRIVNHIRNDGIMDYLDLQNKKRKINSQSINDNVICNNNLKKPKTSFDYIVNEGIIFEDKIISEIYKKMEGSNKIISLNKNNKNIKQLFDITKAVIISKKYDIILNSLLLNTKTGSYGYPDLIVSGSWIKKYIKDYSPCIENKIYYIIDIKATTINLIDQGSNISMSESLNGYKSQIFIYKEILDKIQKSKNDYGFIMAKKYKYVLNKEEQILFSFDMLAQIDYKNHKDIKDKIGKSLEWNKEIEENFECYDIEPINDNILFPNMKNKYDLHYSKKKRKIAEDNKEITLLWNCGIKERNNAIEKGITKYNDKKLTPSILGFKENTVKYNILNDMISILHKKDKYIIPKKNNHLNWRDDSKNEYYVDFETYNDEKDNIIEPILYMIGIGFYDKKNNKWEQKTFLINNKNIKKQSNTEYFDDEEDLIIRFIEYVNENDIQRLIHWSKAETIIFYKKTKIYGLDNLKYLWFDLLEVFKYKEYPIIIKNCFSFNLKSIVNKLYDLKLLTLKWNEINDGLLSMYIAKDIYDNNFSKTISNNKMTSLIKYNEIDCNATYELLNFIRNN